MKYSDILHYFIFPEHTEIFMITAKSEKYGKSLFETYKCKSAVDANKICELVQRACTNRDKRLEETTYVPAPEKVPPPLNTAPSHISIHSDAVSTYEDEDDEEIEKVPIIDDDVIECVELDEIVPEKITKIFAQNRAPSPPSPPISPSPRYHRDFIYLGDGIDGASYFNASLDGDYKMNDGDGPIYMYMKRHNFNETPVH